MHERDAVIEAGRLSVLIGNDRAEIARVGMAVERMVAAEDLGPRLGYAIELAVDELVTNVVCHGYPQGACGQIEVTLAIGTDWVTLTVADDGYPYDPLLAPDPPLTEPLETRRVGGLGIHLVRSLMDDVRYRREGDRNIVTCTLARSGEATE